MNRRTLFENLVQEVLRPRVVLLPLRGSLCAFQLEQHPRLLLWRPRDEQSR